MKIILLIVFLFSVIILYHWYMSSVRTQQTNTPLSSEESTIVMFVAEDLTTLGKTTEAFDSRDNNGGFFYGAGKPITKGGDEVMVPLVLRTTLPATHPNFKEIPTEFNYRLRVSGGTFEVIDRPQPDVLREFYKEAVVAN